MKKSIIITMVVLALIISLLPISSAFAKRETGFVNIEVRNMTNAPVSILFTDSLGLFSHLYVYEPGIWNLNIQKGEYVYKASTSCGAVSGTANFDRSKKMAFHCSPGAVSSIYRALPGCLFKGSGLKTYQCYK